MTEYDSYDMDPGNISKESIDELNIVKFIEEERFMANKIDSNLCQEYSRPYNNRIAFENELINLNNFKQLYQNYLKILPLNNKKLMILDDKYRLYNKLDYEILENNEESHINDQESNVKKKKNKDKENLDKSDIFDFAPFVKKLDYFHFLFISVLIKHTENKGINLKGNLIEQESKDNKNQGDTILSDFKKKLNSSLNRIIVNDENFISALTSSTLSLNNNKDNENNNDNNNFDGRMKFFLQEILQKYGRIYNKNNTYLIEFVSLINKYQIYQEKKIYLTWKVLFGRLVALWDFKTKSGLNIKMKLRYLKIKNLIEKLFKMKEKGKIYGYFSKSEEDDGGVSLTNVISIFQNRDEFPRFTFLQDSLISIFLDFMIDISILYFMFVTPLAYVLNIRDEGLFIYDCLFNGFYFFNMLRIFRTLIPDNMNSISKDLTQPFFNTIKDIMFYFDIITLWPLDLIFVTIPQESDDRSFLGIRFITFLRYFRFGNSFTFLDKTKYAVIFRLLKLMIVFLLLIHITGLFLLIIFENDLNDPTWKHSNDCKTFDQAKKFYNICLYMDAINAGSYMIPGRSFEDLKLVDDFRTTIQYFYMFFCFFLGQLIVASVFSGVSDLIQSMNMAENKFQEIRDNHRITGLYYKFDPHVYEDVLMYYEYIWLKHREKIYGLEMFDNISYHLMEKLRICMIPYHMYLLKDFYNLNKRDSKFITIIINNLIKVIAMPYERLVIQGGVIKGLYILNDGTVFYEDEPEINKTVNVCKMEIIDDTPTLVNKVISVRNTEKRRDMHGEITLSIKILNHKKDQIEKNILDYLNDKIIFPLDSIFMKTGRGVETWYVKNFADLYLIPLSVFDNILLKNFPNEMYDLGKRARNEGMNKIGSDQQLVNILLRHSSRSIGLYYEEKFNLENIWIEIKRPIPKYKIKGSTVANKNDILKDSLNNIGLFENCFNNTKIITSSEFKKNLDKIIKH